MSEQDLRPEILAEHGTYLTISSEELKMLVEGKGEIVEAEGGFRSAKRTFWVDTSACFPLGMGLFMVCAFGQPDGSERLWLPKFQEETFQRTILNENH